jgi:protein O-mannosyl-transferase
MNSIQQITDDCCEKEISHCRKVVFSVLSIAIILLAVYGNSFECSWHFDDKPNITENPNLHMTEFSLEQINKALKSNRKHPQTFYRPVVCLSFALNHYFGGLGVFGYHLVNLVIHFLSSVFLFLFILNTLSLPSLRKNYSSSAYEIALLATILWAINPIQTQAVTYIVQRMASLAAMFYIISMYFYLKARTAHHTKPRVAFFGLSGLSFLLAIGSKENAAMLPMSLFLYEAIVIQDDTNLFFRRNLKWFILSCSIIVIIGLLYFYSQEGTIFSFLKGYERRTFTLAERLLTQPRIFIFYITLLFYPMPHRLSITHSFEISTSLFEPVTTFFAILFVFGLIAFSLTIARRKPLFAYCLLFFILNHLIESTIFSLELIFEHRNYLPSMFLFLPLAMLFCYGVYEARPKRWIKTVLYIFMFCFIISLGHGTFLRNMIWKNEDSLWLNATEVAPGHWRPWHNLGKYYAARQSYEIALTLLYEALSKEEHPNKDDKKITHYNLGYVYQHIGAKEKAFFNYLQAERIDPEFGPARNNKAILMAETGKTQEAIRELKQLIVQTPELPAAHINLGKIFLQEQMLDEAIQSLEKALQLDRTNNMALKELGTAYRQKGLLSKAYLAYTKARHHTPQDLSTLLYLAELYAFRGMDFQKEKTMARFLRLIPEAELRKLLADLKDPMIPNGGVSIRREAALNLIGEALRKKGSNLVLEANRIKQLNNPRLQYEGF